jgi:hypothetical protein
MKKALAMLALGMFLTSGIIGCEASAKVDPDNTDASYTKKTTTVQPSGDTEVKTTTVHHDY